MESPIALKQPLQFGNRAQIEALRVIRKQVAEQEKRTKDLKEGLLKEYFVTIEFTGETTVRVWATSKDEAEDIAGLDGFEPDEVEIDSAYAREVQPRRVP